MEENCSPPAIEPYALKLSVYAPCAVSTIIDLPGLTEKMPYNPAEAGRMADRLIELRLKISGSGRIPST